MVSKTLKSKKSFLWRHRFCTLYATHLYKAYSPERWNLNTMRVALHREKHWAIPFEIHTPSVEDLLQVFHRGSVNFKWIGIFNNSIWNPCPLSAACCISLPQRVERFQVEVQVGYSNWNKYSVCERLMWKLPQGECGLWLHYLNGVFFSFCHQKWTILTFFALKSLSLEILCVPEKAGPNKYWQIWFYITGVIFRRELRESIWILLGGVCKSLWIRLYSVCVKHLTV